ncbi:MAG: aminodeoxychorismate synthase component I [Bacteroidetes bacterium]|jgi:para-aminobenzoate synthetase/4-amino-4-deoxychorismate lyase|nr:aminodeoxychorismate synthase component I [Bacteroidota bacterium]
MPILDARPSPGDVLLRDAGGERWLRFATPERVLVAETVAAVRTVLEQVEAHAQAGGWAAGFVAYEAAPAFDAALTVRDPGRFPLCWFGLYDAPVPVVLPDGEGASWEQSWTPSVTPAAYRRALQRVKHHIREGDTYQVNYSYRLRALFRDDPWPLFLDLARAHRPPYGAYVDTGDWVLCSASPELFFARDGDRLVSRPMKGTAARGPSWDADQAQARQLRASAKDQAENLMIVDMVRNDLSRIAERGSVAVPHLFEVERYPSVWQMTSTVEARSAATLADVFGALFPPASITGAPKARTMQLIAALETAPRRIYTGAIGFVAPDRRAQFNVAIRTLLVDRQRGQIEYGVGGGIVWDSEPDAEALECRTKARVLQPPPPPFELLETMRWTPDDGVALLDYHLDRLQRTAAYFDVPLDLDAVRQHLAEATAGLPAQPHKLRLLVDVGGKITLQALPLEDDAGDPSARPTVVLADAPVDASDPFLYHKTTHRRVYEAARAAHPEADDVLLYNEGGELTESTIANVILDLDGTCYTPPVASGLLAGTYRAWLLDEGRIQERIVTVDDLQRCTAVYLANAVRGLYEVEVLAKKPELATTDDAHE